MRVYTAQELGTSHDCLTPGCPLTAEPGTERCRTHEGRTDRPEDAAVLWVRDGRSRGWADARQP